MQGNVAEWVADFAGSYDSGPVVDPTGPPAGDRHVYRGGSWKSNAESCSVVHRASLRSGTRRKDLGFRIAADPVH
jgi:formylglycine-generating enzyme required for sulfatase activity